MEQVERELDWADRALDEGGYTVDEKLLILCRLCKRLFMELEELQDSNDSLLKYCMELESRIGEVEENFCA